MIRVFIADDHDIVRSGLRQFLSSKSDINICGESETAEDLTKRARRENWDVLVMDINMPGNPGPGMVKELLQINPGLAVVIFTMYPEDSHAVAYLRSGAKAFLSKRRPIGELVGAIRAAAEGKRYITQDLAQYLLEFDIDLSKEPGKIFSERELQVVRHLAQGQSSKQIALLLGVSQATVNTFVRRIKLKLGVHSIVEIVEFARINSLLG